MSLSHELRILELDSQTELLERLRLLTEFGSNFVNVTGAAGAGKSWLAQRYLEAWVSDKNQALLLCHPSQSEQQHRSILLSQWINDGNLRLQDSLLDNLIRFFGDEGCDLVLVIDDAHLLSENLIAELWTLVLAAQQKKAWNISVVLFGLPNQVEHVLNRMSYGQEAKPIALEIEALTQEEADRFFEQFVMRYIEEERRTQIRQAYRKVALLPGEIMALSELQLEKRIIIRSIIGSPFKIALWVLLLVLLLGGGYWWLSQQPSPSDRVESMISEAEQTVIPTLPRAISSLDDAESSASRDQQKADSDKHHDDDALALPPSVTNETASVGETAHSKGTERMVINDEEVDALIDETADAHEQAPQPTSRESEATASTTSTASVSKDGQTASSQDAKVERAVAEATKVESKKEVEDKEEGAKTALPPLASKPLMALAPTHYVLQIAAFTDKQELSQFVARYQASTAFYLYETRRNGKPWFIVLNHQDYPTLQQARNAITTLPPEIQKLGPWTKSIAQIQSEIGDAK